MIRTYAPLTSRMVLGYTDIVVVVVVSVSVSHSRTAHTCSWPAKPVRQPGRETNAILRHSFGNVARKDPNVFSSFAHRSETRKSRPPNTNRLLAEARLLSRLGHDYGRSSSPKSAFPVIPCSPHLHLHHHHHQHHHSGGTTIILSLQRRPTIIRPSLAWAGSSRSRVGAEARTRYPRR